MREQIYRAEAATVSLPGRRGVAGVAHLDGLRRFIAFMETTERSFADGDGGDGDSAARVAALAALPDAAPFTGDDEVCAICQEGAPDAADEGDSGGGTAVALPCGHRYHRDCVATWLRGKPTCPACRAQPFSPQARAPAAR